MRRAELVNLELGDFNPSRGEFVIRQGKRGKSRKVYLPTEAIALVEKWLSVRGDEPGTLLCRIWKGGHLQLGRLKFYVIIASRQLCSLIYSLSQPLIEEGRRQKAEGQIKRLGEVVREYPVIPNQPIAFSNRRIRK